MATPIVPSAVSETQADFEQWAAADPLGDELDFASDEDDTGDGDEVSEAEPSASELFLNLNPGETL